MKNLIIGVIIIMTFVIGQKQLNTNERFIQLENKIEELEAMKGKVAYNVDPNSEKAIEQATDRFLDGKVFDFIWKNTFHWITFFESLDGFTMSGTTGLDGADLLLTTGATSGNKAGALKEPSWQGLVTFNRKSNMRTALVINSIASQTIYITVGSHNVSGGYYYGFKVVNATLYGVSYDGTTEKTVELQTLSASTNYNLEARYLPHEKIIFFVDAVEKGTITANLPKPNAPTAQTKLMLLEVETNEAVAKTIQLSFFEYLQFRNFLE